MEPVHSVLAVVHGWLRQGIEVPLEELAGGRARLKVIFLLACVLGLDSADKATVGALASSLEHALHVGNVEIGWLVTASTAVGVLVTLPFGVLADRVNRTRLLTITIGIWSFAMAVGGASDSYLMLLVSRLFLGGVIAASGPAVVSLIGDFFRPGERAHIYGYILAGELVGIAFGFLIAGNVAVILSWRASFWVLAALGFGLTFAVWRFLREPPRGRQGHLQPGSSDTPATRETWAAARSGTETDTRGAESKPGIEKKIKKRGIPARASRQLQGNVATMPVWSAVKYILGIPSFRSLMIASVLGYFYFTGLRTFAIVYMRGHFGLDQAVASTFTVGVGLGAIAGVLAAGYIADGLIRHGRLTGRVLVGAAAYLLATAAFLPAFLSPSLAIAGPLFFVAAAGIGGSNPAVDAARLDVVPAGLWGRAEGLRATLRYAMVAIAPPLFGYVAAFFGGRGGAGAAAGSGRSSAAGLEEAFLVMLTALLAAGLIMAFRTAKTYTRDVATAIASKDSSEDR